MCCTHSLPPSAGHPAGSTTTQQTARQRGLEHPPAPHLPLPSPCPPPPPFPPLCPLPPRSRPTLHLQLPPSQSPSDTTAGHSFQALPDPPGPSSWTVPQRQRWEWCQEPLPSRSPPGSACACGASWQQPLTALRGSLGGEGGAEVACLTGWASWAPLFRSPGGLLSHSRMFPGLSVEVYIRPGPCPQTGRRCRLGCVCVCVCSVMSHSFETPWTAARQAPLSIELFRQEYWSGLPWRPPRDLPHPGIKPASPACLPENLHHPGPPPAGISGGFVLYSNTSLPLLYTLLWA